MAFGGEGIKIWWGESTGRTFFQVGGDQQIFGWRGGTPGKSLEEKPGGLTSLSYVFHLLISAVVIFSSEASTI